MNFLCVCVRVYVFAFACVGLCLRVSVFFFNYNPAEWATFLANFDVLGRKLPPVGNGGSCQWQVWSVWARLGLS